jgi:GntR family transcriptional regulator/MocR family aminotransferase
MDKSMEPIESGTCFSPEAIGLDRNRTEPLQQQLFEALREAVLSAELAPGTQLPSTRALARQLGLGRNTVISGYEQLAAEGYVEAGVGSGTRVAEQAAVKRMRPSRSHPLKKSEIPGISTRGRRLASNPRPTTSGAHGAFQPGLPALDEFPYSSWARLVARRFRSGAKDLFGYESSGGLEVLRSAIAGYVRSVRGIRCDDSQVIVVAGAQAALDLSARMLIDAGDEVWLENPCYPGARGAFAAASARIRPVPVGPEGLDVELASSQFPKARLAYVTPSFQYPLGVTMSLEQRLRLLEWAEQTRAWIIEDDYDSEYRYRGRSISALQGLDSGARVLYMGTFSKTMFPALRIAYLVVPVSLVQAFRSALRQTGQGASLPLQAALADFITAGTYARHVRRMRALYSKRQRAFLNLAERYLSGRVEFCRSDAGMQLIGYLTDKTLDDREIAERAGAVGVVAPALSGLFFAEPTRRGLFLGYAGVSSFVMERAFRKLACVIC